MKQDETFVRGGNNPYARSRGGQRTGSETYIPGMNDVTPGSVPSQASPQAKPNTPVVGFLYSISRKGIGEYWPLHLGTNTIGRSEDNDICLKEMSVSSKHATLSIKQMKSTHKLIASIRDTGSKTGMFLNDEELDYENHTCKANDIITVGSSYKLLLILIDAEEYGLSVAEGFVEDKQSTEDDFGFQPQGGFGDATQSKFRPYSADNRNVDTGTVDLSGAGFEEPGGTEMM
ncbi:MAG: FHA domain-containing protein [Prevotella sp.]|jgi:pSer/pThr/pTyr-binding forkhead associated (FHA) protein|nr:FHA domain-containing protein [Prevotella sp.]